MALNTDLIDGRVHKSSVKSFAQLETESGFDKRVSSRHHGLIKTCSNYQNSILTLRYIPLYKDMDVRSIESAAISYFEPTLNDQRPYPSKDVFEDHIRRSIELYREYDLI